MSDEITEKIKANVKKNWQAQIGSELTDPLYRAEIQQAKIDSFNANQRVHGLSKGKTMRKVAEVPYYIYLAMKDIFGDDYWKKHWNRHKEFHTVERV